MVVFSSTLMACLEISDQKAAALKAKATMRGVSPEQDVRQMVDRDLEEPATPLVAAATRRHISEVIGEILSDLPTEARACAAVY